MTIFKYFDQLLGAACQVHVVYLAQLLGAVLFIHFISNHDNGERVKIPLLQNKVRKRSGTMVMTHAMSLCHCKILTKCI